jgi:hypothetical protein
LSSPQAPGQPVWLSGAILTLLNKIGFPVLWLTIIAFVSIRILVIHGRLHIADDGVGFIVGFILAGTVFMVWVSLQLHLVGYIGRELVVDNYYRQARIPFDQVAAVDSVWWYRSRLVRVRFRGDTPFGSCIYYLPKWVMFRGWFSKPEEDLKRVIWAASDSLML